MYLCIPQVAGKKLSKMFYKTNKGTTLFNKLVELKSRIDIADEAAKNIVKSMGYENFLLSDELAGGLQGIEIKTGRPEGWKKVYTSKYNDVYMPQKIKKNQEILDCIAALPVVKESELTSLISYRWRDLCKNNRISFYPATSWRDDAVYFKVSECASAYTPCDEMIEITASEYNNAVAEAA